jgi:C4-dicarboxylate-specific signal transduction histidine kinase
VDLPLPVVSQLRWIGEILCSALLRTQATQRLASAETELERHRSELAHLSRVASLSPLSAAFAHEMKQPLTAISSNAYAGVRFLDADHIDRDELQHIFSDIVNDNQRAIEVVRRLQKLFKRCEAVRILVDLNEATREIMDLLRSELAGRSVVTSLELEQRLPWISGDPNQLQQVIVNVILNACEAMSDNARDERRLLVQTERSELDTVKLSVSDNGRGIPPENIERVFEPFFTTAREGLGLGLAVSRRIIAAHDGRLWATANATAGVTLSFAIPATSTKDDCAPAAGGPKVP